MTSINYNPDVLTCLANLSNDEVFTPPTLACRMLDLLPPELFRSPTTRFLDPFTKSGVFLREITRRLLDGLSDAIPDRQERLDHILHRQVFGIAITELTALMSRRSLYCTKSANSRYSVSHFDDEAGNVRFRPTRHAWDDRGRCRYCGASRDVYDRGDDRESHAYEFIHTDNPNTIFNNMKFDVIIGNPPYQLSDGGGTGSSAIPLYHHFVKKSIALQPRYLAMIIPARWYSGGKGLDDFRDKMLHDAHISKLVDYFNSEECFPGIDLSGGVCYFLWEKDNTKPCEITSIRGDKKSTMIRPLLEDGCDSFIRFNEAVSILRKTKRREFKSFEPIVSPRRPFGDLKHGEASNDLVKVYAYPNDYTLSRNRIGVNQKWIDTYKVFIAKAYGERGDFPYLVLGKPFIGEPKTACTETYLLIGPLKSKQEAENVISYIKTRFFRFFVLFKKNTQNAAKGVYSFVPLQDFSRPWTDADLYKKYELTQEEINFIESMIRPME